MGSLTIGAMAVALGMVLSFKLLHQLFPVKAVMPADSSFAELRSRYQTLTFRLGLVMLLVAVPLSSIFWFLLKGLASWHSGRLWAAEAALTPGVGAYWLMPAFLLGLAGGGVAAMWTAQRMLGARYSEFLAYWSLSSGMNPAQANVLAFRACTIICAGLIAIGLHAEL